MSMHAYIYMVEECRVDALQETDNGNQDQIRITSPLTLNAFMVLFYIGVSQHSLYLCREAS